MADLSIHSQRRVVKVKFRFPPSQFSPWQSHVEVTQQCWVPGLKTRKLLSWCQGLVVCYSYENIWWCNYKWWKLLTLLTASFCFKARERENLACSMYWLSLEAGLYCTATIWWFDKFCVEVKRLSWCCGFWICTVFFVIAQSVRHTLPSSAGELLDLPSLVLAHQKMMGPENTYHYWPEILAHTGSVLLKAFLWITFNKRNEGCPWGLGWDWGPFQKREALHWKTVVFYTGDIDGNARIHW